MQYMQCLCISSHKPPRKTIATCHVTLFGCQMGIAPNLKFIDTYANPDTECDKLAPDVGVYPIDDQPQGDGKTDFSKMDLFIGFKIADTSDPEDPRKPKE